MKPAVRLTNSQVSAIIECAQLAFGEGTRVWLFGSRAESDKRGGDIDLYIEPPPTEHVDWRAMFRAELRFLVDLKTRIGDQQIDTVVWNKSGIVSKNWVCLNEKNYTTTLPGNIENMQPTC